MPDNPQFVNDSGEVVKFIGPEQGNESPEVGGVADERSKLVTLEVISELVYEAHRAWEKILGEPPTLPWDELSPEKQQEWSDSVMFILNNPHAPVAAQHDRWRARKLSAPGRHVMGKEGRENPNLLRSFDDLPFSQQRKAIICRFIVHAIVG